MAQSLRVHRQSPATFFAEGFSRIAAERMAGLPICRPDISVQVPQFIPFQGQWLGVAVTPWSLLVLLACGDEKRGNRFRPVPSRPFDYRPANLVFSA